MATTLILSNASQRSTAVLWSRNAPHNTVVTFKKPGRSIPQNDKMWAMLTDISRKTEHNGQRYSPDQWKQLFMHACGHEVHFMAGLNGEPFPAGFRSSKLNKEQMADLITFMQQWGDERGVKWSEPE